LKFPEHTFLAFTFELFALGLSFSLIFHPTQPALAPFFFITPILTFLIVFISCLNSFRVYNTRIALKAYLKKDDEDDKELDTEEELSERQMQKEQQAEELNEMLNMIGSDHDGEGP